MRYLVLTLLIPLAVFAQAPTAGRGMPGSPALPPTPTADLASLEGQVFNAADGTLLRKATISINRQVGGPAGAVRGNYSATSDASGRYSITGIEPGTYRLNAGHTGFLTTQYNARRPGGPGSTLDLGRGQKMTGVDVRLTPHGVITGKITDEDGDPLEGVQIQLMGVVYNQGRKQLQVNGGASTNDLGEYRLSGVTPGKYYLCANYRDRRLMIVGAGGTVGGDEASAQEDYVTTFFSGVTDIAAATPIQMGPGEQAPGINLRLTKRHTARVSGRVVDHTAPETAEAPAGRGGTTTITAANGQSIDMVVNQAGNRRIQVNLQPRGFSAPGNMNLFAQVKPDGAFEFPSVGPGAYYLEAVNSQGGRQAHAARQPLDVGNANIEGINLAINPGTTVTGHIRYDGDPPQPLPSLTVRLTTRETAFFMPAPPPAKVDADGNFRFDDVNPDLYNVNINTPPKLYLKSMRAGNSDVMVSGLDLSNGAASVDILMGTNPPQVSGSVLNSATQQPAAGVTVVLMPREKERQGESYFYSTVSTDQQGNFTFSRVTPGEYQVYAWEDVQYGQWFDPEFMKAYEGKGESLSAREGNPVNVKLTMIPAN